MTTEDVQAPAPGRVLVVEDDRLFARDVEHMLATFGFVHCATACSAEEALRLAREKAPELILMDISLDGELDGIAAAERLRDELGARVIYLTGDSDMVTLERAKRTLPRAYVLKPVRSQELRCCLEVALHQVRSEQAGCGPVPSTQPLPAPTLISSLSARERDVLRMIAHGLTSKDIARKLSIAKPTVDTYRSRLAEKLGARSRADLVRIAKRAGLLHSSDVPP